MTDAELAIMSLIAEQPRHGYDIEQAIKARGMRDWTEIGFSSIYYLLNKLERAGMIESHLQKPEGKGPARKVYSLTQKGLRAQVEGAISALSMPRRGSSSFLLGLSNYHIIPKRRVVSALNSYAAQIQRSLDHMLERSKEQQPLPLFVEAIFDYSRVLSEAELNWIQNFIQEVEAGNVES